MRAGGGEGGEQGGEGGEQGGEGGGNTENADVEGDHDHEGVDVNQHIKEIKDELNRAIIDSVQKLDEAMYLAMISFAFPIQIIVNYIYTRLTGSRYVLRTSSILDMLIFISVGVWFWRFEVYIHADNGGFSLNHPNSPHEYHKLMQHLL